MFKCLWFRSCTSFHTSKSSFFFKSTTGYIFDGYYLQAYLKVLFCLILWTQLKNICFVGHFQKVYQPKRFLPLCIQGLYYIPRGIALKMKHLLEKIGSETSQWVFHISIPIFHCHIHRTTDSAWNIFTLGSHDLAEIMNSINIPSGLYRTIIVLNRF